MTLYVNQLKIIKKGVRKNKTFLREMYQCTELEDARRWFDKIYAYASVKRMPDEGMDLETFVRHITKDSYITLQLASPNPFEIRYCADFSNAGMIQMAWVTCPHNESNLTKVAELYQKAFGTNLLDEPVPEGIQEYYQKRKKLGI